MDLNQTLTKLYDSLGQHSAAALINIKVPNFAGSPGEEVNEFLKKFKMATLTLNNELRCLSLDKALIGSARIWAKKNIKEELKTGNWPEAKAKLRKRFLPPDEIHRHLEKLSKMKYDPKETTLSSYVEVYADLYNKAYNSAPDKDVIRGLRLNLPSEILRHLNVLSDSWMDTESLEQFLSLVQRVERDILPYDKKPSDDTAKFETLTAAIKELRESLVANKQQVQNLPTESVEVVAAVSGTSGQRWNQSNNKRPYHESDGYNQRGNRYSKRFNNNSRPNGNRQNQSMEPKPVSQLDKEYAEKHGKPPGPCYTCGGNHYNRHCPYTALN